MSSSTTSEKDRCEKEAQMFDEDCDLVPMATDGDYKKRRNLMRYEKCKTMIDEFELDDPEDLCAVLEAAKDQPTTPKDADFNHALLGIMKEKKERDDYETSDQKIFSDLEMSNLDNLVAYLGKISKLSDVSLKKLSRKDLAMINDLLKTVARSNMTDSMLANSEDLEFEISRVAQRYGLDYVKGKADLVALIENVLLVDTKKSIGSAKNREYLNKVNFIMEAWSLFK